jgi:hypothetical protein
MRPLNIAYKKRSRQAQEWMSVIHKKCLRSAEKWTSVSPCSSAPGNAYAGPQRFDDELGRGSHSPASQLNRSRF